MTIMHSEAPSPLPAQEIKPLQKNTSATSSLRHSRLCGAALLAFIIPHSSFLIAAPPPELTVLRQQYDKAYAERVTAVFEANKAALDAKFTTALDNAITTAKASGDLPAVLAIQEDKKAIEAKQDLPADTDSTPAALKTLRGIYREQLAKLTEQRTANTTALLTPYAAKLQALEATLTKADRVDEAKEVMDYRVGLKADAPPQQPAMTATSEVPTAPTSPQPNASTPRVKGDDRKAADWVLSVGGMVRLDGINKNITTAADLPKGRFLIETISLDNNNGGIKPLTDADFQTLAGLEGLKSVNLNKLSVSSAIFATLATCPNLERITTQYNRFGDELWTHLAPLQKLTHVGYQFDGLKPTGVGLRHLAKSPIRSFFLNSLPLTDEGLAEMAVFTELEFVGLENAKVTDAGIKAIGMLKKLKGLHVQNTSITAAGLAPLKACPITNLGLGRSASELAVQASELAAIFPKLTTLQMPRDCLPTPDDWKAIAAAFPKLERISFDSQPFKDEHLQGLEAFPALEELNLHYAKLTDEGVITLSKLKKLFWINIGQAQLTDAALETLSGMKVLKKVMLPKPGNGLTADGIAKFKKKRPDVTVE